MYVIGLTGGIGSGKSTVGACFKNLGIEVIDADQAARAVVEPGSKTLEEIARHFGSDILLTDGTLDRRKLRTLIFDNETERKWLEALLHPLIRQWIAERINLAKSPYVILESPLLLETNQHQMVDKVIVVDVPEEIQVQRYLQRDGGTEKQVRAIIAAQMPRQARLKKADYIVDNTGSRELLSQQVSSLHKEFLKQIKVSTN